MNQLSKILLLQASIRLFTGQLDAQDRVAIVVYAGAAVVKGMFERTATGATENPEVAQMAPTF